jgi:glycosyltransferase involved in cell wall biosynthesis
MTSFLIVTHVPHIKKNGKFYAYAPYVREMNIWLKHVDHVLIAAPVSNNEITKIEEDYIHHNIEFISLNSFNIMNSKSILKSIFSIPSNFFRITKAITKCNHLHLRCPGNIGLLGVIAQLLFPKKIKTAKYAGNWDHKAKMPLSYKLQKTILSNTFFTKNMQVLVYGDWKEKTKNIKPFFTATYKESDKVPFTTKRIDNKIDFIFVGMLTKGKQPLYAIQLVEELQKKGFNVKLSVYGEGTERELIEEYIQNSNLQNTIILKGNQDFETVKKAYQESHFVILPSLSEGWPKALAEGMFWGCVPISTTVSCVPNMLDYGKRGLLLTMDLAKDVESILQTITALETYLKMQENAVNWSRKYTLDYFEKEIEQLLEKK